MTEPQHDDTQKPDATVAQDRLDQIEVARKVIRETREHLKKLDDDATQRGGRRP